MVTPSTRGPCLTEAFLTVHLLSQLPFTVQVMMPSPLLLTLHVMLFLLFLLTLVSADFFSDVDLEWGGDRAKILDGGRLLELTVDGTSGSGFRSKNEYLYGKIDMQVKVVPGYSAGIVTAYYVKLASEGWIHDEIDFEFLGNVTGEPYTLHTNIYTQGQGNREQQFHLWFDPRDAFHTYSILWNQRQIIFYVDGIPIRVFQNMEGMGVPYPKNQPMRLHTSTWNADQWATRGGLVKTDWSHAPFTASFRSFVADACVWSAGTSSCSSSSQGPGRWRTLALDNEGAQKLRWVRQNYMIYDYCRDPSRFPGGLPRECSLSTA